MFSTPLLEGAASFSLCNACRDLNGATLSQKMPLLTGFCFLFAPQHAEVSQDGEVTAEKPKMELLVALTSDRGLCGAVHSSICRTIKAELNARPSLENVGIICVGDKSRAQLQK